MPAYCVSFYIHQPCRLKHYSFFDIGESSAYEDEAGTKEDLNSAVEKRIVPALQILLKRITQNQGDFRIALTLSGSFLDSCEHTQPRVLDLLTALADTGCVEFLGSPYHHSLSSSGSIQEFKEQIVLQANRLNVLFGQEPTAFANTGLIYNDALAREIETLGYLAILAGRAGLLADHLSPSHVYRPASCATMKLLLNRPLEPTGLARGQPRGKVISLFCTLDSDGETPIDGTDLLAFLDRLPGRILSEQRGTFLTPSQVAREYKATSVLSSPDLHSLSPPHDLTSWLGNEMQKDAFQALYLAEGAVKRAHNPALLRTWRLLQDADYFLCMGTRKLAVSATPSHGSPYDAYINFMNILTDLTERTEATHSYSSETTRPVRP
jgi:alpha-amylase